MHQARPWSGEGVVRPDLSTERSSGDWRSAGLRDGSIRIRSDPSGDAIAACRLNSPGRCACCLSEGERGIGRFFTDRAAAMSLVKGRTVPA